MRESICERAHSPEIEDAGWREHALGCADCRELVAIDKWMTAFAARTVTTRDLPAPGYLLVKARIQERRAAMEQAARPLYMMRLLAGAIFAGAVIGVFALKPRFGSVMIDALSLLSSYAAALFLAAVTVAIVYLAASYIAKETRGGGSV